MKLEDTKASIRLIAGITCIALFASCATAPQTVRGPEYAPTASLMREARSANVPVEKRAADYLQAAAITAPLLGTGIGTPACETYNAACGELTVLLRSSEGGRLWNHPLTLNGNKTPIIYGLNLPVMQFGRLTTSLPLRAQIRSKKNSSGRKTFRRVLAVRSSECESSIRPKSSCRPRESPHRSQLRSIFTQRMLLSHFAVPPSNRWPALKENPVLWRPISQRRSATTSRRVIFCSSD